MGIDYEVRLFFGKELENDDIVKIGEVFDTDMVEALWEEHETDFSSKFPNLYLGYSVPYYDDEPVYHVGIRLNKDTDQYLNDTYTIEDLKTLLSSWKTSGYKEFLQLCNIKFSEPRIVASPHVC